MLSVLPAVEWSANLTRSSWQSSLRIFHKAVHVLARSWSYWTNFGLGHYPRNYLYGALSRSCCISWTFSEILCWHIGNPYGTRAPIITHSMIESTHYWNLVHVFLLSEWYINPAAGFLRNHAIVNTFVTMSAVIRGFSDRPLPPHG